MINAEIFARLTGILGSLWRAYLVALPSGSMQVHREFLVAALHNSFYDRRRLIWVRQIRALSLHKDVLDGFSLGRLGRNELEVRPRLRRFRKGVYDFKLVFWVPLLLIFFRPVKLCI